MWCKSLLMGWLGVSLLLAACHFSEQPTLSLTPAQRLRAEHDHIQLGLAYLQKGLMPRAKQKLLYALQLSPRSAEAHAAMGFFLEKTGDLKNARRYYESALQLAPKSGAQQNNWGAFLCRTGAYRQGLQWLLVAAQNASYVNTAMAYENAGVCAKWMGAPDKSRLYFQQAILQDPARTENIFSKERQSWSNRLSK